MKHQKIGSHTYQFNDWQTAGEAYMMFYEHTPEPTLEQFADMLRESGIEFVIDDDWVRIDGTILELAEQCGVKISQEPYTESDAAINAFAKAIVMRCVNKCSEVAKQFTEASGYNYDVDNTAEEIARFIKMEFDIEE